MRNEESSGKYGGLFKSTDGGTTWKDIIVDIRDYGVDEQGNFIGALYNFGHAPNFEQMLLDPVDHRRMLVGHHGENVFMTNDDGKTWAKQSAGMIPDDMHNYAYCLGQMRPSRSFTRARVGGDSSVESSTRWAVLHGAQPD